MGIHSEAILNRKYMEMIKLLNIYLELSHWHIQKIKKGINFVGYRTWKSVKFVRKHSIYKMKRAIKKIKVESIVSLIGHAKDTGTLAYYKKLLIEFDVLNLLPQGSRRCLDM